MDVIGKKPSEKRLIYADALRKEIERIYLKHFAKSRERFIQDTFKAMFKRIDHAPTVDAVEVVRCCECKFGTHFGDMEDEWIRCMNLHGNPLMRFDGCCSYGEREEND